MTSFEPPSTKYILHIAVLDSELRELYQKHIDKHNSDLDNNTFPNAGFDLFVPNDTVIDSTPTSKMVGLGIKCEMVKIMNNQYLESSPFYMYPRSSISKTPLMLANHVGIIDSGYRGELIAALRNLSANDYLLQHNTRLMQICLPSLESFTVKIVEETDLSTTARGSGGFGSTGSEGMLSVL